MVDARAVSPHPLKFFPQPTLFQTLTQQFTNYVNSYELLTDFLYICQKLIDFTGKTCQYMSVRGYMVVNWLERRTYFHRSMASVRRHTGVSINTLRKHLHDNGRYATPVYEVYVADDYGEDMDNLVEENEEKLS